LYPFDSFGCSLQFLPSSSSSSPQNTIAVGSSSFTPHSSQVNSGAVFLFQMAPVAPSSIGILAKGGSGSPIAFLPPPPPVVPRVTFHHLFTLFHPDKDSATSSSVVNTYFGKEIYFTGEMAFISAFTASFSGIVYYYEKNVVTGNYEMKQAFTPSQSPFQPNYMNYFGSSVVIYSKKIQLGVPSVRKIIKEVEGSVQSTETTDLKMMKSLQEWFPASTDDLGVYSSSNYSTGILLGGESASEEPSNQGEESVKDGSAVESPAADGDQPEEEKSPDVGSEQPSDNNSNQGGAGGDVFTAATDRSGDEQPQENSPFVSTDDNPPVVSFLKIMNEDDTTASKDISNSNNNDPVMVVPENDRKESSQTLSLLFVNSPGSSLTPYSTSSSSSASTGNGVVYVYSNHHSLLRNMSCELVGMELAWEETIDSILLSLSASSSSSSSLKDTLWTSTEIKQFLVYYQQLCANYSHASSSSKNEWTLVHQFTLNPTVINSKNNNNPQLFNPQFGQQLLISNENNNNHNGSDSSLFISAPGLSMNYFDPIAKKINSVSSGVVYEDSAILTTLIEELTNQMTMILNDLAIHKETSSTPPTDTSTDNNDNNKNHPNEFISWISSKNGIIITATCFPMLLLIVIIGYLFSKNSVSYYSSSNGDFSKSVPTESPTKDRQKRKWAQYSYFVSGLPPSSSSQKRSSPLVRKLESNKEETSTHSMVEMNSKMIQLEEGKATEKEIPDKANEEKEDSDPSLNNSGPFSAWKEWMGSIKRTFSSSATVSYETISNSLIATTNEKAETVVEPELSYDFYLKNRSDSEAASTKSFGEEKKVGEDNGKDEEKIDWIQNPLKMRQNKMAKKNLIEEKPVETKKIESEHVSSFSFSAPPPSAPAGESSADSTGNQFYRVNIPGILSSVLPSSVILPTSVLPVESSSSSVVTATAPASAVHMEEIRSPLPREEEQQEPVSQPVGVNNSRPLSFGSSSLYQQWMTNISRSFSKSTSYTNLNNLSMIVNEQPSSPMEREMQVMNRDKEVEGGGGEGADGKGGYYV
jgi:hypothetical protein